MKRLAQRIAVGSVLLAAGLLSARAQGPAGGVRKDIVDLAGESQAGADVSKKAAALTRRYPSPRVVMRVYNPRESGGIGFGSRSEGMENKLVRLGEHQLSAETLKKEAPDLLRLAPVSVVVAEVLRGHAPKKPLAGRGKKEWDKDVEDMKKGSQALLEAIKASDAKAVKMAAIRINNACDSCHGNPPGGPKP